VAHDEEKNGLQKKRKEKELLKRKSPEEIMAIKENVRKYNEEYYIKKYM
jgi:hypothetical protein